jgi:CheY-like chemotaxis protein
MLGVILGYTELTQIQLDPSQPLFKNLEEIRKAAQRSADITQQLLAFARKQTVSPRVLDLNETVEGMLKMLRRLIGEDIQLEWQPAGDLWPVCVDPSQIDQMLANLCLNARGAIADIGAITIETGNCTFDAAYSSEHPEVAPGEYVRLRVSDNGSGIEKEMLPHIFEPFFTTKGIGEGTGLGLAMVYGAVKQNNGFIQVDSEAGQGTTFTIYLPRFTSQEAKQAAIEVVKAPLVQGHETVLLVEDEPGLLEMFTLMLDSQGYLVLNANSPGEAMRLAKEHDGEIHLLVIDVVMPEMNGRNLADSLLACHPNMKSLFMSGYTADVIAHHGVLDAGVCFLQKPFTTQQMAVKVREALESQIETTATP